MNIVSSIFSMFAAPILGYSAIHASYDSLEIVSIGTMILFNFWIAYIELARMSRQVKKYLVNSALFWFSELLLFLASTFVMEFFFGSGNGIFYVSLFHLALSVTFCIKGDVEMFKAIAGTSVGILALVGMSSFLALFIMTLGTLLTYFVSFPPPILYEEPDFRGDLVLFTVTSYSLIMAVFVSAAGNTKMTQTEQVNE